MPSRTWRSVSMITVCRMISNRPPVKAQIVSSVAEKQLRAQAKMRHGGAA